MEISLVLHSSPVVTDRLSPNKESLDNSLLNRGKHRVNGDTSIKDLSIIRLQ